MKKIQILVINILVLVALSGCSVLMMEPYDNNEYYLANKVRTKAELIQNVCNDSNKVRPLLNDLKSITLELKNYSEGIQYNENVHAMGSVVHEMVLTTKKIYVSDVSEAYCEIKFKMIEENATKIQEIIGAKPK